MCLYCKVRVAVSREARVLAATTSPEAELSEMNQNDQASSVRNQREVDPEEQDYELNEAVNLEGNGVLVIKQSSEESSMIVDQSNPSSHTATEEP